MQSCNPFMSFILKIRESKYFYFLLLSLPLLSCFHTWTSGQVWKQTKKFIYTNPWQLIMKYSAQDKLSSSLICCIMFIVVLIFLNKIFLSLIITPYWIQPRYTFEEELWVSRPEVYVRGRAVGQQTRGLRSRKSCGSADPWPTLEEELWVSRPEVYARGRAVGQQTRGLYSRNCCGSADPRNTLEEELWVSRLEVYARGRAMGQQTRGIR